MADDFRKSVNEILQNYASQEEAIKARNAAEAERRQLARSRFNEFKESVIRPVMEDAKVSLEAAGHEAQILSDENIDYGPGVVARDLFIEFKVRKQGQVVSPHVMLPHLKYSLESDGRLLKTREHRSKQDAFSSETDAAGIENQNRADVEATIAAFLGEVFKTS
ncbi:hypothetical protein [Rhizobium sp. NFR03]|uniref:hypothetical protein n=1 Tax=Rhizobium sp. NFR03 TaxID=1566263 RepID=UPI0008B6B129|nr:hypothetical protein [Rhizobium sp. NFR03]SES38246.1 hypothetical protein SAMN03159406_03874 [Rhizobium sp. NFR03]